MEFSHSLSALIFTLHFSLLLFYRAAFGATFTFTNKCDHTVWPGVLANAGSPSLATTGFELLRGSSRSFTAPSGWSGRFWGRTGCTFSDGAGSCQTGDCGSGRTECAGAGAAPPATLAELTLSSGGLDFYDVSLVDGFNLPMLVEATGGSGMCVSTGCVADLSRACPTELRAGSGGGCRSACEAFGKPEYCCSGAYNSPRLCRPSSYSQLFKAACPRSYSYAYDDPTSTFTCSGADYTVTFCPSMPSQKSAQDPTPTMSTPGTSTTTNDGSQTGSGMGGSDSDPGSGLGSQTGSGKGGSDSDPGSGLGLTGMDPESEPGSVSQPVLTDKTWLAGLAMGDSTTCSCSSAFRFTFVVSVIILTIFS